MTLYIWLGAYLLGFFLCYHLGPFIMKLDEKKEDGFMSHQRTCMLAGLVPFLNLVLGLMMVIGIVQYYFYVGTDHLKRRIKRFIIKQKRKKTKRRLLKIRSKVTGQNLLIVDFLLREL